MKLAAFFHTYAAGDWREPTIEFLTALEESAFPGRLYVGLIGSPQRRAAARRKISKHRPDAQVVAVAEASGLFGPWEELTLRPLHEYARKNPGAVLYMHTKSASYRQRHCQVGDETRRNCRDWMQMMLVSWRTWHAWLKDGIYDAVGPFWESGMFEPNFWVATCAHLRTLPEFPAVVSNRVFAQTWIGYRALHGTGLRLDGMTGWQPRTPSHFPGLG